VQLGNTKPLDRKPISRRHSPAGVRHMPFLLLTQHLWLDTARWAAV